MPADFLDTSALAKHYHAEVGSDQIDGLWNDPGHGLFVSRLFGPGTDFRVRSQGT